MARLFLERVKKERKGGGDRKRERERGREREEKLATMTWICGCDVEHNTTLLLSLPIFLIMFCIMACCIFFFFAISPCLPFLLFFLYSLFMPFFVFGLFTHFLAFFHFVDRDLQTWNTNIDSHITDDLAWPMSLQTFFMQGTRNIKRATISDEQVCQINIKWQNTKLSLSYTWANNDR